MAITAVGGTASASGAALKTLNISPTTIGDVLVLAVACQNTTSQISAVSGGGVTTRTSLKYANPGYNEGDSELWFGPITTTGTANVTITTTATGTIVLFAQQYTIGAPATWSADGSGAASTSTSTSSSGNYPSVIPARAGELYVGCLSLDSGLTGGSTAGFTYDGAAGGGFGYNPSASNPTAQSPDWTNSLGSYDWSACSALLTAALPATGAIVATFAGSGTGVLTYHSTGSMVATFAGSATGVLHLFATGAIVATFAGSATALPPILIAPTVSAVAGYDGTTPTITVTVSVDVTGTRGAFTIGVTLLRNDGTYVIGASPLDPLWMAADLVYLLAAQTIDGGSADSVYPDRAIDGGSADSVYPDRAIDGGSVNWVYLTPTASIVDLVAPYGVETTYVAEAIITEPLGAEFSPPSIPSLPVLMGQAPDTTDLYDRMGWARDEDTGDVLEQWLSGIGQLIQTVDNLSRDEADANGNPVPGWSQVLDVDRAPTYALPWLAQFLGVRLDPSMRDDQMRYAIENPAGFARGTPGYIIAAANQYILPGYTVTISERDTSPYHLTVTVPAAGIAGGVYGSSTYLSLWQRYPTYTAMQAAFATYAAIWNTDDAQIIAAIDATIPAGIQYSIIFD